jgi:hypothetical protein
LEGLIWLAVLEIGLLALEFWVFVFFFFTVSWMEIRLFVNQKPLSILALCTEVLMRVSPENGICK